MNYLLFLLLVIFLGSCQSETTSSSQVLAASSSEAIKKQAPSKVIKPYVHEKGNFSIVFPDSPSIHQQKINAEIGSIQLTQLLYEKEKTQAWLASYSDYPSQMMELSDPKKLLEGIKKQVLSGLRAKAKNEQAVSIEDYDGIAFSAYSSHRKMTILYRIYLVKNRVYQLAMFSSIGDFSLQDSSSFMDSFRLLNSNKKIKALQEPS